VVKGWILEHEISELGQMTLTREDPNPDRGIPMHYDAALDQEGRIRYYRRDEGSVALNDANSVIPTGVKNEVIMRFREARFHVQDGIHTREYPVVWERKGHLIRWVIADLGERHGRKEALIIRRDRLGSQLYRASLEGPRMFIFYEMGHGGLYNGDVIPAYVIKQANDFVRKRGKWLENRPIKESIPEFTDIHVEDIVERSFTVQGLIDKLMTVKDKSKVIRHNLESYGYEYINQFREPEGKDYIEL
jgi:hypothetical protein